jgi:hypothetical protein
MMKNRVKKHYRVMWDQNSGMGGFYNPPISPERNAQAHFGFFAGRSIDAYVGAPGCNAGYTLAWPTEIENAEFMVDRLNSGAAIGSVQLWRHAENLRRLWADGHDPIGIEVAEANRLGIDHWIRLSMNDWHHWGSEGTEVNLQTSRFYDGHPEYLIGEEGTKGWSGELAKVLPWFQDFAHEEVRALRRDVAVEACTRYDLAGFLFDFMRCPGYFKYGQEEAGAAMMTDLIRDTRAALDRVGEQKGRTIGLAVRVPNTIDGTTRLGLDVASWVTEGLVDIVVPSCFFGQDMEEDVAEWVELAHGSGVRVHPAIEEAYMAGHTSGFRRWYFKAPVMTPLPNEMIRGLAARHLRRGVDGLYVFNFFGTAGTYDYDNREALDDIGDVRRLEHKSKIFALTRSGDSFPNCLPTERLIPAPVTKEPLTFTMEVPDDLHSARDRLHSVSLWLHLNDLTVEDEVVAEVNGVQVSCVNPMQPGGYDPNADSWLRFDLMDTLPVQDANTIAVYRTKVNARLMDELPVELVDVELEIRYDYPDGEWRRSPGWYPRTE